MNRHYFKKTMLVALLSLGCVSLSVQAKSDKEIMAEVQKARAMKRGDKDHSQHVKSLNKSEIFRGIFYGYVPCDHCPGIKMTLSLKNKHNYLLVRQYAQASNKEYYEKGKYIWDEVKKIVTLTPRKNKGEIRKFYIEDETKLIQLTVDEHFMKGDKKRHILRRGDTNKSRTVHIH